MSINKKDFFNWYDKSSFTEGISKYLGETMEELRAKGDENKDYKNLKKIIVMSPHDLNYQSKMEEDYSKNRFNEIGNYIKGFLVLLFIGTCIFISV